MCYHSFSLLRFGRLVKWLKNISYCTNVFLIYSLGLDLMYHFGKNISDREHLQWENEFGRWIRKKTLKKTVFTHTHTCTHACLVCLHTHLHARMHTRVTYTSTRIIPLSAKKVLENAISGLKLGGFWHCCHWKTLRDWFSYIWWWW